MDHDDSMMFDLDDSEIVLFSSVTSLSSPAIKNPVIKNRPVSMPINVPDWTKILKLEAEEKRRRSEDKFEDSEVEEDRIPPHEFLARARSRFGIASFSMQEGIGRTLKGRDLSRVRNAVWQKTGFED